MQKRNSVHSMSNLLLISGNGRNVGKTYLACKTIEFLSENMNVTGVKISPHFHTYDESSVIIKNKKFIIVEEKLINGKDSSLMLQAGAKRVFFLMVKQQDIEDAFESLKKFLPDSAIVCESGGLSEVVKPGIFLFVKKTGDKIEKKYLLQNAPVIVNNDGTNFDFDIRNIQVINNSFYLKS